MTEEPTFLTMPPAAPLRVVVADDNPVVRAGLAALLATRDDIAVVAEAADGRQAYEAAVANRPDVIMLDVRMPGVDGMSALPYLVRLAPVLMLTYSQETEIVQEAIRLGASGYLVHGEFTADQLVAAVRDIRAGRASFTATAATALLAQMRGGEESGSAAVLPDGLGTAHDSSFNFRSQHPALRPQSDVAQSPSDRLAPAAGPDRREHFGLSQREEEVMELIASGMSNQHIAASCFIAEKTVKNHVNRIFSKLQAVSRSEAIAVWLGTARGRSGGPSAGMGPVTHG
jgi:DNA-binding NarL/FixJ family response regulator